MGGALAWSRFWEGVVVVCLWGCENGFFVEMASPGICVLCLANTCTSKVRTVFNPVQSLSISAS